MEKETIIKVQFGDLVQMLEVVADKAVEKFVEKQNENKILTQSQAMKELKIGNAKLKELIYKGILKTTADGRIVYKSIMKYYNGN